MTKKLTPDEHHRRGTFRPYRHGEEESQAKPSRAAVRQVSWLKGLPREARAHGWILLKQFVVTDRAALRQYLLALNAGDDTEAMRLLAELRLRPRSVEELRAAQEKTGLVW